MLQITFHSYAAKQVFMRQALPNPAHIVAQSAGSITLQVTPTCPHYANHPSVYRAVAV